MKSNYTIIVRILAAIYLIYLGYSIIKDLLAESEAPDNQLLFIIVSIAFIILGILLIVSVIRNRSKDTEEEDAESDQEASVEPNMAEGSSEGDESAKAEEPEAVQEDEFRTMTIAERIRRLSEESDEEDEDE